MQLLSIQSHVVYGHVGNSAAVFPLQRLGCEVWPIHTVQFSNHTGYGAWAGSVFDAATISALVDGVAARGVLGGCAGVISGYIGSPDVGASILACVAKVKVENPQAHYCCDPVIGDFGRGVFVRPGVAEFMRRSAVCAADIVTPNHFELDYLTGRTTKTLKDACRAIDDVHALGPRTVVVTSLCTDETPSNTIDLLASDSGGRVRVRTPKLPVSVDGAGDVMAALFFFHLLRSGSISEALPRAVSSVFGLIQRTAEVGVRELRLVGAQDEIVNPSSLFSAEKI
jgi:pyridoxine kinase